MEVNPQYAEGLKDIDGFSHIILLYAFHESSSCDLQIKPFLDDNLRGLLTTRNTFRPNPIGLSVVRLLRCEYNNLEIEGVDELDGTPLLDIKPYEEDFYVCLNIHTGWFENRSMQ